MTHTRREFIESAGKTVLATAVAAPSLASCMRDTGKLELRWLGWEHYDVPKLRAQFEKENNCIVKAQYFDGNSEAHQKLKSAGKGDFHLVMADGFWPRLYHKQGLTQPLDEDNVPNRSRLFKAFTNPSYPYLRSEDKPNEVVAMPNCWGGYGLTVNVNHPRVTALPAHDSLQMLFEKGLTGHIATSARFEENIALTGILVAHELGTISKPRPSGKPFNPYDLTPEELQACEEKLRSQAKLLATRWHDEDTLERLLRSEDVLVSPEWSGIFRRIKFEELKVGPGAKAKGRVPTLNHFLHPREGGLGWVDTWAITSGTEREMLELAYKWIDFRLRPESMRVMAQEVGWAPCIDIRENLLATPDPREGKLLVDTLFLDKTDVMAVRPGAPNQLYQFDQPSAPEQWEKLWARVLQS